MRIFISFPFSHNKKFDLGKLLFSILLDSAFNIT